MERSEHDTANLLLRAAVAHENGDIILIASGSREGLPAEIGGILFHFSVS